MVYVNKAVHWFYLESQWNMGGSVPVLYLLRKPKDLYKNNSSNNHWTKCLICWMSWRSVSLGKRTSNQRQTNPFSKYGWRHFKRSYSAFLAAVRLTRERFNFNHPKPIWGAATSADSCSSFMWAKRKGTSNWNEERPPIDFFWIQKLWCYPLLSNPATNWWYCLYLYECVYFFFVCWVMKGIA